MEIKDINLKLLVVENLLSQSYKLPTGELLESKLEEIANNAVNPIDYKLIPEVMMYIQSLDLSKEYHQIKSIWMDGGNQVYLYTFRTWDGEDNQVDINSFEGIELLENLENIDMVACYNPSIDFNPLLKLKNLNQISGLYFDHELKNNPTLIPVFEELSKRGVTIDGYEEVR